MIQMMKKQVVLFVILLVSLVSYGGEGMWLPQLLQSLNEKDMKKQGMKMNASDIYSISKSSLKDAIVSLGGFCTAEVISNEGLLLTNHHCAFDAIQNQTTLQNNYIRNGFWAMNKKDELPNHGLTATFIVRIDDVTKAVLQNVNDDLDDRQRQSAIDKNINQVRNTIKKEAHQSVIIRPFFEGNKYYLFVTEVFQDVRLVGAPPAAIGNFGKDTDNWVWPRHTGDFTLFRIYAGKDNKPAPYSPDNVPYKPKRALKISLDGVDENDFTMIFGFPGRTYQYLPASAVSQIMNVSDPAKIAIREKALKVLDQYMRSDEQIKIQYATKYARIENAYKKWKGEVLGLRSKNAVGKKQAYEQEFEKRVAANPRLRVEYGNLLQQLDSAHQAIERYGLARDIHNEVISKIDAFTIGNRVIALVNAYDRNGLAGYQALLNRRGAIDTLFNDINATVDRHLFTVLMDHYVQHMDPGFLSPELKALFAKHNNAEALAEAFYSQTILSDTARLHRVLNMEPMAASDVIKDDIGVQLLSNLQRGYIENVSPALNELQATINTLQRKYMKAQMEAFPEKEFYPDANSTLRVTYGQAKGMKPRNGIVYTMMTDLDGVMEKYVPGDYEFDVPEKLIALHAKKDYGRYSQNGKMPVCFIATNHTTGGNSGSPALDAYGNLVGLNFDRAWEGTMSDIFYDETICRNIMVDIRYVLFIIDKFAGAKHLVDEMQLVHPKKAAAAKRK